MRIIDADAVIYKLKILSGCDTCGLKSAGKCDQEYCQGKLFIDLLDKQPTAFDVDKVVEQLEKEKCKYQSGYPNCDECEYGFEMGVKHSIEKAIEIVRKGGVE